MDSASFDLENKKIWVTGHTGLVGSALLRRLSKEPCEILTVSHNDLDLTRQRETEEWMSEHKPDAIIVAAGKVGGIGANAEAPADFLYDNTAIAQNIIHTAYKLNTGKLLYLGSSCIYPKQAQQPITEDALLSGALEPTNEGYAIAKITGLKLCEYYNRQYGCDFISVMPTNLYGPGDTYNENASHVIPALIHKIHQAKMNNIDRVEIWGSGKPFREFLYVDDLADAIIHLLKKYSSAQTINVGSGQEFSIAELAQMIARVIDYEGDLFFNADKPDGAPRKRLDLTRLEKAGWRAKTPFEHGLKTTYESYLEMHGAAAAA